MSEPIQQDVATIQWATQEIKRLEAELKIKDEEIRQLRLRLKALRGD